jgi:hypothetical protein
MMPLRRFKNKRRRRRKLSIKKWSQKSRMITTISTFSWEVAMANIRHLSNSKYLHKMAGEREK